MAKLLGRSIIGFREGVEASVCFYGLAAASGQRLEPGFFPATPREVELAAQLAREAFAIYGRTSGREKGRFVRKIAANLEGLAQDVIERAHLETALPKVRLQGEMGALAVSCVSLLRLWKKVRGLEHVSTGLNLPGSRSRSLTFAQCCVRSGRWPCLAPATSPWHFQLLEGTQHQLWLAVIL